MRFHVILNKDGGTLRTLDLDAFSERTKSVLENAGHQAEVAILAGADINDALEDAAGRSVDVIMVGGGDGTISSAASTLRGTDKMLAVLPAGTMNLFARSLAIPLNLDEAVAAFATGDSVSVDLASANGKVFVHQFSVGLHPELIRLREEREYGSRVGKIWASFRAGVDALFRSPRFRAVVDVDGQQISVKTSSIGITNNVFGEGHLPYADTLTDGVLGVYVTRANRRRDLLTAMARMALGRWKSNPHIDIFTGQTVKLTLLSNHTRLDCAMDGELAPAPKQTTLRVHPAALRVLVPCTGKTSGPAG